MLRSIALLTVLVSGLPGFPEKRGEVNYARAESVSELPRVEFGGLHALGPRPNLVEYAQNGTFDFRGGAGDGPARLVYHGRESSDFRIVWPLIVPDGKRITSIRFHMRTGILPAYIIVGAWRQDFITMREEPFGGHGDQFGINYTIVTAPTPYEDTIINAELSSAASQAPIDNGHYTYYLILDAVGGGHTNSEIYGVEYEVR